MLLGHIHEDGDMVYVTGSGQGDAAGVEWTRVLSTAWTVIQALRRRGIHAVDLTIVDLNARIPLKGDHS